MNLVWITRGTLNARAASKLTEDDENLMHDAIVSKWNICATD